jgi:uncharacterized coiled-coil protein SlyX
MQPLEEPFLATSTHAKELIEKMMENQGWDGDRLQSRTCGVHQVDGIDMIAAKMDLLMKKLEASSNIKTAKIMDAHMTCEVCGNVGHSGNDFLETRKEASFINNGNTNGFRNNNFNNQGWNSRPNFPFNNQNGGNYSITFNNQTSIKDLVFSQAKINENINKKLAANEKVLENLNSTIESFTCAMIETQLSQLAVYLPSSESGGIPGQPEPTWENLKSATMRGGKTTQDPPHPNPAERKQKGSDHRVGRIRRHQGGSPRLQSAALSGPNTFRMHYATLKPALASCLR